MAFPHFRLATRLKAVPISDLVDGQSIAPVLYGLECFEVTVMPGESHRKAAEQHERAAHAHRAAASHQEEGAYMSARELSRQALEHATKAFKQSQEAYELAILNDPSKSGTDPREPVVPGSVSVK